MGQHRRVVLGDRPFSQEREERPEERRAIRDENDEVLLALRLSNAHVGREVFRPNPEPARTPPNPDRGSDREDGRGGGAEREEGGGEQGKRDPTGARRQGDLRPGPEGRGGARGAVPGAHW